MEEQLYDDSKKSKTESMVSDTVTDDAIAEIVAKWTGIPVSKLLEGDMQKLLRLQSELDKRVVGQSEATRVVAEAIQRSRAGELYGQILECLSAADLLCLPIDRSDINNRSFLVKSYLNCLI